MEEFLDDMRLDSQVASSIKLPVPIPSLGCAIEFARCARNVNLNAFKCNYLIVLLFVIRLEANN